MSSKRSGCRKFSSDHSSSVLFYASHAVHTPTCSGVPVSSSLHPNSILRSTSPSLLFLPFSRCASSTTSPAHGIEESKQASTMAISYVVSSTSNSPCGVFHSYFLMFSRDSTEP